MNCWIVIWILMLILLIWPVVNYMQWRHLFSMMVIYKDTNERNLKVWKTLLNYFLTFSRFSHAYVKLCFVPFFHGNRSERKMCVLVYVECWLFNNSQLSEKIQLHLFSSKISKWFEASFFKNNEWMQIRFLSSRQILGVAQPLTKALRPEIYQLHRIFYTKVNVGDTSKVYYATKPML